MGPTPLRRLTRTEYRNTVADLFGVPAPRDSDLPDDTADSLGFATTTSQSLSPEGALKYFDVAATVGGTLFAKLPDLFPCAAGRSEAECVKSFLDTTGTRMFRRPLTPDEQTYFAGVFAKARANEATFDEAALALVQTLLVTPQFLFLIEPAEGSAAQPVALDSWQVATRLSYLLWQTTPDSILMEAASRDELRSKDAVLAHARRMLASPRAKTAVASFFDQWLMLGGDREGPEGHQGVPRRYPEPLFRLWQPNRACSSTTSSGTRTEASESCSCHRRAYASKALSTFYGDSLSMGDSPGTVSGEVSEKSFGLFSQAGFLMGISRNDDDASIFRGKFVLTRMFCQPISCRPLVWPRRCQPSSPVSPAASASKCTPGAASARDATVE